MVRKIIISFVLGHLFLLNPAEKIFAQHTSEDLTNLSLEDLMNVEVYSASKMPERFFDTAAAIYIITPDDIRRSGITTIPELLRMVPGFNVQKINSHTWDISARGFNGSIFANKLLVIMDGRAVYSPLLGGVFWELQDTVLDDIERIEVIRGPGGTMWGANAVNGVINIITKKAKKTQGGLVSAGGGLEERFFSTLRYGSKSGDWYYRTYAKYLNRDEGFRSSRTANDEWSMARTGFRAEKENLTLQGDYYQGYLGQRVNLTSFTPPHSRAYDKTNYPQGANLLARYTEDNRLLQGYWQMTNQNFHTIQELRHIFDVEYNQYNEITTNQEISWGLGYRLNIEDMNNTETLVISQPERADQLFSLFAQDTIKMLDDKMKFIIGTKFEYNIYTNYEIQPNVRLSYDLNDTNIVWAAASRAVRTPSRLDIDGHSRSGLTAPALFTGLEGNHDLSSEKMRSFELGYRTQPTDRILFDLAAFADHYDDLITYIPGSTIIENGFPVQLYPSVNGLEGEIYGLEFASDVKINAWWKVKGAYTFTKLNITTEPDIVSIGVEPFLENAVPHHTAYVRSSFDLPHGFELDTTLRYMDSFQNNNIPSSTQLDINIGKTIKGWQLNLVGQNLVRKHHKESYGGVSTSSTQVERGGYMKATHKF